MVCLVKMTRGSHLIPSHLDLSRKCWKARHLPSLIMKQSSGLKYSVFHSMLVLVTAQTGALLIRTSLCWTGAGLTEAGTNSGSLHCFCGSHHLPSSRGNGQQLFPEWIYASEPPHHPLGSHLSSGEFDICPQRAHPTGADTWQSNGTRAHPPWLVQTPSRAGKRPDVQKGTVRLPKVARVLNSNKQAPSAKAERIWAHPNKAFNPVWRNLWHY